MANVYAVKNGNWSDTTLWNTSSLPTIIDDVYANNFTVYVDISPQVSSVRNLSATSITRGGSFILNNGVSLSANVIGGGQENIFCVRFLSAAPTSAFITGNISTSGSLVNVRQSFALELSGTGTLTVYGSAIGGNNNNSGTGVSDGYIQVNAPGTFNIFGDVQGSLNGNVYWGINNRAAGTVNIVGNVAGRTVSVGGVSHYVVYNASTGTVNVTGNVNGGVDNTNVGIYNNSTGVVNVRGNVTGGLGTANTGIRGIVNSVAGTVNIIGDVAGGQNGHEGVLNNSTTGVVNITGTCFGGYLVSTGSSQHGVSNNGVLNVFGGAIGGTLTTNYGINNGNSPATVTLYGNVSGYAGVNANGIRNGTGTVNVIGNTYGGQGTSTPGIVNGSTGSIFLTGDCYGYGYIPINRSGVTINGTGGYGIHNVGNGNVIVTGNVYSSNLRGDAWGIDNSAAGTVTVNGNVYGGNGGNNAWGIRNNSSGFFIINGSCFAGNIAGANGCYNGGSGTIVVTGSAYAGFANSSCGVFNNSTGTIIVSSSVVGNGTGGNSRGAENASTGTIIIGGAAIGGNFGNTGYGVSNNTTGIVRVKRAVGNDWGLGYTTALAGTPGVFSNVQGSQTFVEELECGPRGQWPTAGVIFFTPNPKATSHFVTDTFQNYSLIQSNSADNLLPPVSSVRQGTTYSLGLSTGTCAIPPASSVGFGVSVDNTTGTATLVSTNVWNISSQEITDNQSIGGRLKNTLTANAAERLVNSFNLN